MPNVYKEASIECKVLKVLYDKQAGAKGSNKMRIVQWVIDGKETAPQLEKRNFFLQDDGKERMGKTKGFTVEDVEFIKANMEDILGSMKDTGVPF